MEKLRTLRTMVWLIAAIMALELCMLAVILRPGSFFIWAALGLIALMAAYLVRICLVLLKELAKREDGK